MIKIKLTNEDIDNWIAALRSGKYKQGYNGLLHDILDNFCCLGVLCDVHPEIKKNKNKTVFTGGYMYFNRSAWISDFVNFPYDLQDELMYMNDEKRFSFSAIADYIEENRNKIINRQEPSERPDRTD